MLAIGWCLCLKPQVQRNILNKNSVTEYLQLLARSLTPSTMFPLLSKVLVDLHHLHRIAELSSKCYVLTHSRFGELLLNSFLLSRILSLLIEVSGNSIG